MFTHRGGRRPAGRRLSVAMAALLVSLPLAGCGRSQQASVPPPYDTRGPGSAPPGPRGPTGQTGMSTGQKVAILAGAAALYYLYNSHKNKQGNGKTGQYYLSKNGRVYYRDPQNPQHVIWVTPPPQGIQVPASEAEQYSRYQGYNNQRTGSAFGGYGYANQPMPGGPPGPQGR